MRKALDCENQQVELLTEYEHLMQEKIELEQAYIDLKQKSEQTERRNIELRTAEEKQHAEEISFIKKTNQQLKVFNSHLIKYRCIPHYFMLLGAT